MQRNKRTRTQIDFLQARPTANVHSSPGPERRVYTAKNRPEKRQKRNSKTEETQTFRRRTNKRHPQAR